MYRPGTFVRQVKPEICRLARGTRDICSENGRLARSTEPLTTTKPNKGKFEVEKGVSIYWERHGNGPKAVLFCPGLAGSIQTNFLPVFKKMDHTKFTLIGVDPEGYGKSRPPSRNVFTEEFVLRRDARRAGKVMTRLGYEKYAAVGWSNGALTAFLTTVENPGAVTRVVLSNAPVRPSLLIKLALTNVLNLNNWDPRHRKDLLRIYEKEYAVQILKDWRYFIKCEMERPKHFVDFTKQLHESPSPLLFINGTKDSFTHPIDAFAMYDEFFSSGSNNKRLHIVRSGTHFHLDFLDEFVDVISEYLDDPDILS